MKKLSIYSLIAALLTLIFVGVEFSGILDFGEQYQLQSIYYRVTSPVLFTSIWLIILAFISAKGSPLKTPAYLGIAALLLLICELIWNIYFSFASLVLLVAFIWISRYFKRGSLLQISAISMMSLPILLYNIVPLIIGIMEMDHIFYSEIGPIYYPIVYAITNLLYALFFYLFYKSNKQ